jgi:hypothetical protein
VGNLSAGIVPTEATAVTYDEETENMIHDLVRENVRLQARADRALEVLRYGEVDEAIEILGAV